MYCKVFYSVFRVLQSVLQCFSCAAKCFTMFFVCCKVFYNVFCVQQNILHNVPCAAKCFALLFACSKIFHIAFHVLQSVFAVAGGFLGLAGPRERSTAKSGGQSVKGLRIAPLISGLLCDARGRAGILLVAIPLPPALIVVSWMGMALRFVGASVKNNWKKPWKPLFFDDFWWFLLLFCIVSAISR